LREDCLFCLFDRQTAYSTCSGDSATARTRRIPSANRSVPSGLMRSRTSTADAMASSGDAVGR
jgi:hypothetical protein